MKTTITEMKNTLEGLNNILDDTKDQTSDLKNRVVEITKAKQKKIKNFSNEHSLKDHRDNIKHTNTHIIGVPEE